MSYRKWIFPIVNLITLAFVLYIYATITPAKSAYFLNQAVFEASTARQELELRLGHMKTDHQKHLDSLTTLMQTVEDGSMLVEDYREAVKEYTLQQQKLTETYTAELWRQINQYVNDYGEEHDYDYIFGATGDGSLMYANLSRDITDQIITYINKRYEGEN
ncbi:OmpH family outer membrane protein [Fulvivirga sp. M361]|uniref:OmpH family outer membrane protein n=1 Tax=Fulvivirga sp. M361 TaxID=2594266 RepID=UPI00117A7B83|nr:OmpH family outer membrane protein [Fulvivirga sp. M361]TRX58727.1 OmpH family outer membrane protein [Fulvivirga sp. M361]